MLEDFRGVAVGEKAVGFEIFTPFDEVETPARVFARAAGAGLAVADNSGTGSKQTRLRKRLQGKNHAGGITAGVGNQTSFGNFAGVEFGNAVDGFVKPFGMGRRQLIPGRESFRFAKAEGSAQVDDTEACLD